MYLPLNLNPLSLLNQNSVRRLKS